MHRRPSVLVAPSPDSTILAWMLRVSTSISRLSEAIRSVIAVATLSKLPDTTPAHLVDVWRMDPGVQDEAVMRWQARTASR